MGRLFIGIHFAYFMAKLSGEKGDNTTRYGKIGKILYYIGS